MEYTQQDVIDTSSVLKYGNESPLITTEVQELIKDKLLLISVHYQKDDELFRKNCVDVFEYFYKELKKWKLLYFIRCVTEEHIHITYKVVPEFKYLVDNYGPLLRAARCYKEKNE